MLYFSAENFKSTTKSKSAKSEIKISTPTQLLEKSQKDESCNEKQADDSLERKFLMDQARRELPYTFKGNKLLQFLFL